MPGAPGTAGSLASLFIWAPMVITSTPWYFWVLLIAVLYIIGVWASNSVQKHMHKKDPGLIVIDEVVGQGIALMFAMPNFVNIVLGFILFRLFDVLKPWPANVAEEINGGTGVMLDDVIAGIYAAIVLALFNGVIYGVA